MPLLSLQGAELPRRTARRPDGGREQRRGGRAAAGAGPPAGRGQARQRSRAARRSGRGCSSPSRSRARGWCSSPSNWRRCSARASRWIARSASCSNCRRTKPPSARSPTCATRCAAAAPLSAALERQHGTFSRLYINMVRAGEAGGSLHETLARLADYLERSPRTARPGDQRADLSGDPAGDGGTEPAVPAWLRGAAVRVDVREPGRRAAAVHASSCSGLGLFVRDWWILLLAIPGAGRVVVRSQAPRPRVQGEIRRLAAAAQAAPGRWSRKIETARLARTLGTLVRNGVPLLTALGIGRNVLGNRVLAADVEAAADEVKNGVGLSTALARGKRFPRLALQMIRWARSPARWTRCWSRPPTPSSRKPR